MLTNAGRGGDAAAAYLAASATADPSEALNLRRAAAEGLHPSIVHIYDIATHADGETPIMVMEFVRGESLSVRLQDRKRTPWREAFSIVAQAASALGASHAQDIIHRDIKPDNLIVCDDGTVKVLDFGIAQLITELSNTESGRGPRRRLTGMNMVPGTAGYMSPEQFIAGMHLDGRSDVYSLGVVLYRLLSAKRLWPTVERHEIAQLVQTENPPDIQSQVLDLPDHAAQVVRRAIERDRGRRFASMDAMRDALLASLEDEAATTTVALGAEVSPADAPVPNLGPTGTSRVHQARRVGPRAIMAVASAVVLATCVLTWLFVVPRFRAAGGSPLGTVGRTAPTPSSAASHLADPARDWATLPGPAVMDERPPEKSSAVSHGRQPVDSSRRARPSAQRARNGDADAPADPFEGK